MYVFMLVCMNVCVDVHVRVCIRTTVKVGGLHAHTHTHTHHAHTCTRAHTHTHTHITRTARACQQSDPFAHLHARAHMPDVDCVVLEGLYVIFGERLLRACLVLCVCVRCPAWLA